MLFMENRGQSCRNWEYLRRTEDSPFSDPVSGQSAFLLCQFSE
jgi:hypothetical protein